MRYRKSVNKRKSAKAFNKGHGRTHPKNVARRRAGYRL